MPNRIFSISLILGFIILGTACVQFKTMTLYDEEAQETLPEPPEKINLAVEPTIFLDDTSNVWGVLSDSCKTGNFTSDTVFEGNNAIHIAWDRSKCEWVGFGIGWDDWVGKDLSEIQQTAAFSMYVRSRKGIMYSLPIVLTLEDYRGKMAFAYTSPAYYERPIDEEWQRVVVPLSAFDYDLEGIDPTNVKQLLFELQNGGDIYLDDIKVIPYEKKEEEVAKRDLLPDYTQLPIVLFDDSFSNDDWVGLWKNECQDISITTDEKIEGEKSLKVFWDLESRDDCPTFADSTVVPIWISWSGWHAVDMTTMDPNAELTFYVKNAGEEREDFPITVGLQDFEYSSGFLRVNKSYTGGRSLSREWLQVRIPIRDFLIGEKYKGPLSFITGSFDPIRVRCLDIQVEGAGKLYFDDIRLELPPDADIR